MTDPAPLRHPVAPASGLARVGWLRASGPFLRRSPRLAAVVEDCGNNLDLVRLVAAVMVVWGHAPFFSPADAQQFDPVIWISGGREYAGSAAVQAFFLVSGLLVSGSMERHRSAIAFALSRLARIWPGFMACVAVLLYAIVPLASGIPLLGRGHLKDAGACLRGNAFFPVTGVCDTTPGAFPHSPIVDVFGFPFWTLVTETHCYALVLILGVAMRGRLTTTKVRASWFMAGVAVLLAGFCWSAANPPGEDSVFRLDVTLVGGYSALPVLFFLGGMGLHGVRRWIPVSTGVAVLLTLSALVPGAPPLVGYAAFAYGILAFAACRPLRRLRPAIDLSYGIYLYGAAMQQVVVGITGQVAPWINFIGATPLATACAYASWKLVEGPSIKGGRALIRVLGLDGGMGRAKRACGSRIEA